MINIAQFCYQVVGRAIEDRSWRIFDLRSRASLMILMIWILVGCSGGGSEAPVPSFKFSDVTGSQQSIRTVRPYSSQVIFEPISLEEGLSQSSVYDILQDNQGLIWIATMDGLNRYDGYNIDVFKHIPGDEASISENFIAVLFEDSRGVLWVGTEGSGLDSFDRATEAFSHFQSLPGDPNSLSSNHIRSISEDASGDIWVGTVNGLNRLDGEGSVVEQLLIQENIEVGEPQIGYISDMHLDENGIMWIGSLGGLHSIDPESGDLQEHVISPTDPAGNSVLSIYEDYDGLLWIGTLGGGLHMLDSTSGEVTSYRHEAGEPTSLAGSSVGDIIQDPFGALWVATENGLDRLAPDRERFIHYDHDPDDSGSIGANDVRSLLVDDSGVLWVGSNIGGISKSDPYKVKFNHLAANPNDPRLLSSPLVWTIFEDSQGYLWIGTANGLDRLNQSTGKITRYSASELDATSLPNGFVTDIAEDDEGRIWIATYGGLTVFDEFTESFGIFHRAQPTGQINKIHFDDSGSLWIGKAGTGLDRLDLETGNIKSYTFNDIDNISESFSDNNILVIYGEEDSPFLWLGTMGGLVQFDIRNELSTTYRHDPADPNSLGYNTISAIAPDGQGGYWLATGNGLGHFDPSSEIFSQYQEADGLANNMVLGIEIDEKGRLWISTNRGLSRFDPTKGVFRNFDTHDGLQSLEFNGGAHFQSDSGKMYFGGINGINSFRPDDIFDNPYIPPVVITDFQILNRTVEPGSDASLKESILAAEEIEMTGQESVFSFEIASLHYGSPDENQYAYILEGFDKEWNYIGDRRFASYTNVPPGEYTFRALATNNDGVWNLDGTTVDIVIPSPFWQQWWFAGLTILMLAAVAGALFRSRSRTNIRRTHELEEQVATRTAEIEQRRQVAEGLREILVILNTSPSLEESLDYIVAQAAKLTDAEDAIIFRCPETGPVVVVATNPGGQIRHTLEPSLLSLVGDWSDEALLNKEPLIISELTNYWKTHPVFIGDEVGTHSALLGIPLVIAENIYGGLLLFYDHVREFDQEDLELGFTFADQAALAIANNQLRDQVKRTAAATERSRLARDLHDAVTQTLFSASLIAESLAPTWESDPDDGRRLMQDLRQLTRGALAEMRTLLMELRPAALEEAQLAELFNQLGESAMGRSGVLVTVEVDQYEIIPVNVRVALYRIAQESLNNIVKHSRAESAKLSLQVNPTDLSIMMSVVDDGCGFDPEEVSGHHLGLDIIRERAQGIGAKLSVESAVDQGTRITVFWRPDEEEE